VVKVPLSAGKEIHVIGILASLVGSCWPFAKTANPLQLSYINLSVRATKYKLLDAKTANQGNSKAKFSYIPALWYSNLAVQKQTT